MSGTHSCYLPFMPVRAPALPPEQRRAAIIAATPCACASSAGRTSPRAIADAAGIACRKGTILPGLPDKEAVLEAV